MPKDFDLVQYPFKIKNKNDALIYRVGTGYEMRFTRDIFSKRVYSTLNSSQRKHIEIEINGKEARVLSEAESLHEFTTPADFFIPQSEESLKFYTEIHSILVGEDLENLAAMPMEIDKYLKTQRFPEFSLPIATTTSHFENYETSIAKLDTFPHIPIVQARLDDDIPEAPLQESMHAIKDALNKEQYDTQDQFYKFYFNTTPISRFKTIARIYEESSIELKRGISLNILKRCIGIHAYFVTSGPWRKCWVRFGYDPKLDSENYKYQVIEMRTKKANFQIFQKPEIETEVAKNKEWYVLKEFDPADGFISKSLKNFIIYTIDEKGAQAIDSKIEELQYSDFEIFD